MLIIDDTLQGGVPALLVMLGVVTVLVFIRFVVPWLIVRFQTKKPVSDRDLKK